jgi:DNA-binding NarL/FixJ family response regulator
VTPAHDRPVRGPWPLVDLDDAVDVLAAKLADRGVFGVLLGGVAGVGKTSLAFVLADRLTEIGSVVHRVTATVAASSVPLGALRRLGHSDSAASLDIETRLGIDDPTFQIRAGLRASEDAGVPGIVVVDDAPLLDPSSADLLAELARSGSIRLVLTARNGQSLPSSITALLVEDRLLRHRVEPMSDRALAAAAATTLGGRLSPEASAYLARSSGGLPLHARELLASARLTRGPDGWDFDDVLESPPTLVSLVAARFSGADEAERMVLEWLSFAVPFPITAVKSSEQAQVFARLERAELLTVRNVAGVASVEFAHPLFDESVRAGLGPLQRRASVLRAAEMLEGAGSSDLALRAAHLRFSERLPIDAEVALDAARQAMALALPALAEELLAYAGDGFDAALLLAAAVGARGRVGEADARYGRLLGAATTDAERARVVSRWADTLRIAGRFADAIDVLDRVTPEISDPSWQSYLRADVAYLRLWLGTTTPLSLVDDASAPVMLRANECLVGAVQAVMNGRLADTEKLVDEGMPLMPALERDVPSARTLLTLSRFLALGFGGRGSEAEALVSAELERVRAVSWSSVNAYDTAAAGLWLSIRAMQTLANGSLRTCLADVHAAVPLLQRADLAGLLPLAQAVEATALGALGRTAESVRAGDAVELAWRDETKVRLQLSVAEAWRLASADKVDAAVTVLIDAAEVAADNDHVTFAGLAAYDAVRLDRARMVAPTLRSIAEQWDGQMAVAMVRHLDALLANDPDELLNVASELVSVGLRIAGAEAAVQASARFERVGATAESSHASYVAAELAAPLDGACTLILGTPRGLTSRESEIIGLATEGRSSRSIADSLDLSVRTVENHLASAYRKLGVSGRRDLAQAALPIERT